MKYCYNCDQQLKDDAKVCTWCGCEIGPKGKTVRSLRNSFDTKNIIKYPIENGCTAWAKFFMVLGIICDLFTMTPISLLWTIPMTVSYFSKIRNGEVLSVAFKVCSLLFVSGVAGILMLCDPEF